jgi:hypothetical protein
MRRKSNGNGTNTPVDVRSAKVARARARARKHASNRAAHISEHNRRRALLRWQRWREARENADSGNDTPQS